MRCASAVRPWEKCACGEQATCLVTDPPARSYAEVSLHCAECHVKLSDYVGPPRTYDAKRKPFLDKPSPWNEVEVPMLPVPEELK